MERDKEAGAFWNAWGAWAQAPRLFRSMTVTAGLLVVGYLAALLWDESSGGYWMRLFDLDGESNLPTWFSSAILGLGAIAAYQCSRLEVVPERRWLWVVITGVALLLSVDEVATLHDEILPDAILERFRLEFVERHFRVTAWPVLLGPFVLAALWWLAYRVRSCLVGSPRAARRMALGVAMFLTGSLGLELATNLMTAKGLELLVGAEILLEECLEMFGGMVVLSGLLAHQAVLRSRRVMADVRSLA